MATKITLADVLGLHLDQTQKTRQCISDVADGTRRCIRKVAEEDYSRICEVASLDFQKLQEAGRLVEVLGICENLVCPSQKKYRPEKVAEWRAKIESYNASIERKPSDSPLVKSEEPEVPAPEPAMKIYVESVQTVNARRSPVAVREAKQKPIPAPGDVTIKRAGTLLIKCGKSRFDEDLNFIVHNLIRRDLTDTQFHPERGQGCIYILQSQDTSQASQKYVKIGLSVAPRQRRGQLSKCFPNVKLAHESSLLPHVHRVEQLVHAELHQQRWKLHQKCVACGDQHQEVFEVELQKAIEIVDRWANWALLQPWNMETASAGLKSLWQKRLEISPYKSPRTYQHLAYPWQHWLQAFLTANESDSGVGVSIKPVDTDELHSLIRANTVKYKTHSKTSAAGVDKEEYGFEIRKSVSETKTSVLDLLLGKFCWMTFSLAPT